jgi:hypothetical protein
MADKNSVFAMNNLTVTSTTVPNAGADNHIPIKGSAGNWKSITGSAFLKGLEPGQEQVLVNSGDQSIAVQKNRMTIIGENEILEVIKHLGLKTGIEHYIEGPGGSTKIDGGGVTIIGQLVKINSK